MTDLVIYYKREKSRTPISYILKKEYQYIVKKINGRWLIDFQN